MSKLSIGGEIFETSTAPIFETDVVTTSKVIVDHQLDGHGATIDESHIALTSDAPANDKFVLCQDSSLVQKAAVTKDGELQLARGIFADGSPGNFNIALEYGQLRLSDSAPADDNFLICEDDAGEEKFTVDKVGNLTCTTGEFSSGVTITGDAALAWLPGDGTNGELRFGRQQNYADPTVGRLDGIHHQRTIDSEVQIFQQQLHQSEPKIDIYGTTENGVDWVRIKDSLTNDVIFSIHDDGTLEDGVDQLCSKTQRRALHFCWF
jgi:hypothetical protein